MELLHKGKVKEVYDAGDGKLLFKFTDQISVFDKIIPTLVPQKGAVLARTAKYWFEQCEKLGIKTHFIDLPKPDEMLVQRMNIVQPEDITPETTNFFIPLEVIVRHYLTGSMYDRVKKGIVKPETMGLPAGQIPPNGVKLPQPFVEFTTKFEAVDRPLSEKEAFELSGLTEAEFADLKKAVLKIDEVIAEHAMARGIIHVDGKKEFGMGPNRELIVVDTFGTPDEDRWWDAKLHEQGQRVDLSKEFVRNHFRETGYHAALDQAREAGGQEPPIPALPPEVTAQVTELYIDLYQRLTGQTW